jgi:hypothetical protein
VVPVTSDPDGPETLRQRLENAASPAANRREPVDCGHYGIRVARDGSWYYRGSPIERKPLVTLFSSVLRRDSYGVFWLETPVEKGRIDVDDAPFVAVELFVEGDGSDQTLTVRTNLDEIVAIGPDHPLRVETDAQTGEPAPYVVVRDGLDALIARSVYYELVDLGVEQPDGTLGVWSGGIFSVLGAIDDEEDA